MRSVILGVMSACNWLPTNAEVTSTQRAGCLLALPKRRFRCWKCIHNFRPRSCCSRGLKRRTRFQISLGKQEVIRSGQLDVVRIGRRVLVSRDALLRLLGDMETQRHPKK
jgi:hypothetical protein